MSNNMPILIHYYDEEQTIKSNTLQEKYLSNAKVYVNINNSKDNT